MTTLKARLLNLPVEFKHPSNECPVFTVNTLLKPRFAAHSSVVRGRWGLWGKKKKKQKKSGDGVSDSENKKERQNRRMNHA